MALARTDIGIFSKLNAGTPAFTTEEFTPPANSLLVVRVYAMRKEGESSMGTPTISGGGLTYAHRSGATTILKPSWSTTAAWFTAPVGGSPAKMAITVDEAANLNVYEYVVSVVAYTGYDTTTPIGGTLTSGATNINDGEESRELSEAPASGDETLVCIDGDSTKAPLKPSWETGWTLVHEKSASNESGIAIASRGGSTSKVVKVKDSYVGGGSFSKAGMGAIVVRVATESLDVTISVPAATATAAGIAPTPTVAIAAAVAPAVASASPPAPTLTVAAAAAGATAAAPAPSPAVAIGTAPASAAASAPSPVPAVAPGVPAAQATAGAPAPSLAVSVGLPPATAVASAPAPVPAVLIGAPPALATASAPPPSFVVEEATPAYFDLDMPTTLVLSDAGTTLQIEGRAARLVISDPPATTAALGSHNASLTVADRDAELDLADASHTLALGDDLTELKLDG